MLIWEPNPLLGLDQNSRFFGVVHANKANPFRSPGYANKGFSPVPRVSDWSKVLIQQLPKLAFRITRITDSVVTAKSIASALAALGVGGENGTKVC